MTSRGNVGRAVGLAVGVVMVLVGCQDSSNGTPTSAGVTSTSVGVGTSAQTSPATDTAPWDPCTLSPDALRATGLDPDSKKKGAAGVDFEGWKVCNWRASARWYTASIFAGSPSLQEVRGRKDFTDLKALGIDGRQAVQFKLASDNDHLGCGVAVEVPRGTVIFDVLGRYSEPLQEDPCVVAGRHATELAKYLP
ncbi:hypothetical protein GCM10009764_12800 [Nocardia ninae]|uniref:DUF3558 domain-containing protein n=2 Tax=Nocardia ninae TaxID=356145 RepID=A0A511MFV4_9NOCA|nr:hypothetical protein NN4_34770 [Nocardia ninae NBRC 108245]